MKTARFIYSPGSTLKHIYFLSKCSFYYFYVLLHVIDRSNNKHLMTGPEGNSEFCFLRISMFPETKLRETLRFEGNKIRFSPRDQSLSDLLHSKNKTKANLKTELRFQRSRATAANISRVTVNCFPFDVIVFRQCCPLMAFGGKQFHC